MMLTVLVRSIESDAVLVDIFLMIVLMNQHCIYSRVVFRKTLCSDTLLPFVCFYFRRTRFSNFSFILP